VFDRFDGGLTIGGVLPQLAENGTGWPELHGAIEEGVLSLIEGDHSAEAVEKVA
jgi:hypothetical protein